MSSPRLKILHLLVSLPVGGAEDLVATVVRGLDLERFTVTAACISSRGAIGEELAAAGYPVICLGLDLKRTSFHRLVSAVRGLIKEQQPDILHTHLYHPNLYGRLAALGLGLSGIVASVHNSYPRVKLHRCLFNFLLARFTDYLLVGSPQVWEDVRRYDRVPRSRMVLMPYGIPLQDLEIEATREEAKARLGVAGFCLGMVGRLEEQKGQEYLLAALPDLRREIPHLTVLLVGEGRREEALRRQVHDLDLAGIVHFLGTRRDLPLIYRALDLYVHPSRWEGLSLAILKAMGAGLPVIASRVSGTVEVIEDGVSGRLIPPEDPPALAAAVSSLYRHPEQRRFMGQSARQAVQQHHSQETMLRRLESLYLKLGEKGRRL